jgi:hypothetical protein
MQDRNKIHVKTSIETSIAYTMIEQTAVNYKVDKSDFDG